MNKEKCAASRERGTAPANLWGPPCLCLSLACTALLRVGSTVRAPTSPPPALTYADLIVCLSIADAAELKLIEGICKLALGRRQICERGNADVSTGTARHSVPPAPRRVTPKGPPCRAGTRGEG